MSAREWKPGDVAMVTWKALGELRTDIRFRGHTSPNNIPCWWAADGSWVGDHTAKDVRPLVVIDPDDREQVERLWRIWTTFAPNHRLVQDNLQAALREFAEKPPKPEEPTGLGAVVEDAEGRRWTRYRETTTVRHWHPADGCGTERRYAEIDGVKVLSEGVL